MTPFRVAQMLPVATLTAIQDEINAALLDGHDYAEFRRRVSRRLASMPAHPLAPAIGARKKGKRDA